MRAELALRIRLNSHTLNMGLVTRIANRRIARRNRAPAWRRRTHLASAGGGAPCPSESQKRPARLRDGLL